MSKNYCINCWYPLESYNTENCPDCGYPDNEGENMTLDDLISEYQDNEFEMSDVRKGRMIDRLIEEHYRRIKC